MVRKLAELLDLFVSGSDDCRLVGGCARVCGGRHIPGSVAVEDPYKTKRSHSIRRAIVSDHDAVDEGVASRLGADDSMSPRASDAEAVVEL